MKKIKYSLTLVPFLVMGLLIYSQQDENKVELTGTEEISVTIYKNPACQCCAKWAGYLEENGFSVEQIETQKLASIKEENGIPNNLGACHTALIEEYVIEGHVPVEAIDKLLAERPEAKGIAVPGMPAGSPGMDQGPISDPFDVILFDDQNNQSVFSRH